MVSDSEESPLLPQSEHDLVYQRFSPGYKTAIVALVSWCALMPLHFLVFITGTFYPSIPQIARDLHTTGEAVSFTISVSVLSTALGSFVGASYSTFYGRRRVYLVALPISVIASLGVAAAQNVPQLLFWRVWQCAGASPGRAVGAGVIGDMYKLEERGTALGFFNAGSLLGPAIAPLIGGFIAHYSSWKFVQCCIGIAQLLCLAICFFALPETSHPGTRGIDKLRLTGNTKHSWKHVNPLRPLNLLRSPTITAASFVGFCAQMTEFVLIVPLSYTIGKQYHLDHNEALVGACLLPSGLGNMVGAATVGRLSDKIVVDWKKKRNGEWYPEDRLRASLPGALFLCPLSALGCGLVTQYIKGYLGLALNLILLFLNGVGIAVVLSPIGSYGVDVLHSRSAEATACNSGFRRFLLSFGIAAIMAMINDYGMLATNTAAALLAWIGFP
ncbi:hypothetical protein AN958_09355 [Leucoagaricus sp. SymC.cos]|nr:hypothetical protein AN958_09355 [Leucoagaricus sp. SymC.cos]